jgi:hypothetical protein
MRIEWIAAPALRTDGSEPTRTAMQIAALVQLAFVLSARGKSSELEWTEVVKLPDGFSHAAQRQEALQ